MAQIDVWQAYMIVAIVLISLLIFLLNRLSKSVKPIKKIVPRTIRVNTGKKNDFGEDIIEPIRYTDKEYGIRVNSAKKEHLKKMIIYQVVYLLPIVFTVFAAFIVFSFYVGTIFFFLAIITATLTHILIKFYGIGVKSS